MPFALTPVVRSLTLFAMALTSLFVAPRSSHACSEQPREGYVIEPLWEEAIRTDGILVWEIVDLDGDPSDVLESLDFAVRGGGTELSGSLELFEAGVGASTAFVIWRPDQPLQPGTVEATIDVPELAFDPPRTVVHSVRVEPGMVEPLDFSVDGVTFDSEGSAVVTEEGRRVCCEVGQNLCGFGPVEECQPEFHAQLPELAWDGLPASRRPYTLVRVLRGEYSSAGGFWESWNTFPFPEAVSTVAEEYCVRARAIDLISGEVQSAENCVPHVDLDLYVVENDLQAFVASECLPGTAVWEDTAEPFEEESVGCSINGDGGSKTSALFVVMLLGLRRRVSSR